LVALLDSDDEWLPGKLPRQRALMQARPDVLFCFSDFAGTHRGQYVPRFLVTWHRDFRPWDEILNPGVSLSSILELPPDCADCRVYIGSLYRLLLSRLYVYTTTVVVRKKEAGDALRFAEDLPTYEDWECFARLARVGPAAYLECETAIDHSHPGPRLTDCNMLKGPDARLTLLSRVWGSDSEFLALHRDDYLRVCAQQRLLKAKGLIRAGYTRLARDVLRDLDRVPRHYYILSRLPGWFDRGVFSTYAGLYRRLGLGWRRAVVTRWWHRLTVFHMLPAALLLWSGVARMGGASHVTYSTGQRTGPRVVLVRQHVCGTATFMAG
jgi:hypothetical protein